MKNKHVMTLFAVLMLCYQAWRVYDYMGTSLTDVSDTVRMVVSVAFLTFSEIGLLAWLHVAQPNATTDLQETVATSLVWVDFVGSMVVGLGDMLKHNQLYRIDLSAVDPLLFLTPWLMVVLNLGAYLVYHMNDSDNRLEREERRLQHEEHDLEIHARRAAIRELKSNKEQLAERLSPHYVKSVQDRVTGRTMKRFVRQAKAQEAQSEPVFSGNGGKARAYDLDTEQAEDFLAGGGK